MTDSRSMLAVRVLGCSGSYAAPGGACTGYLIESEDTRVWLDAGPGTLANLQRWCSLGELDALVLTHAHPDHWLELPVVANAIEWYEPRSPLPVYSNAHMFGEARQLMGDAVDAVLDWTVVDVDDAVTIGDQAWTFAQTEHYVPTFATRIESQGSALAFSSDTGPGFSFGPMIERDGPINLALIESTFVDRSTHEGVQHLAAAEAGAMAAAANVERLVLTHLAPKEDSAAHLSAARGEFDGDVALAEVGALYAAARNSPTI